METTPFTFGCFTGAQARMESRTDLLDLRESEYKYFMGKLLYRLRRFTQEEAESLAHDAILYFTRQTLTEKELYAEKGMSYYLSVKAKHLAIDAHRKANSTKREAGRVVNFSQLVAGNEELSVDDTRVMSGGANLGPAAIDAAYIMEQVERILEGDPVRLRVFACMVEGMTPRDIAYMFGEPEGCSTAVYRRYMFELTRKLTKKLPHLRHLLEGASQRWTENGTQNRPTRFLSSQECLQRQAELEAA